MNLNYVLRSIFALLVIIWLANVLLKKLNSYTQGQSKAMKIIERFSISKNSSLLIVKILDNYYLMSVNENNSEILKEFTADEVNKITEIMHNQEDYIPTEFFTQIDFSKLKNKYIEFFEKNQ